MVMGHPISGLPTFRLFLSHPGGRSSLLGQEQGIPPAPLGGGLAGNFGEGKISFQPGSLVKG